MPFVQVRQQRIYYAARGTDTSAPLVFIHGAGGTHLTWNGQLGALADVARTYALDLPGHGRSDPPGRRSIREYADFMREWLDAMSIKRAVIAGSSMGGAIGQMVALDLGERVAGLVLVGTGARLRVRPEYLEGLLTDFTNTAAAINAACFSPHADPNLVWLSQGQLLATDPQVVHDDYAACNEFDLLDRVSEIRAPTLIVCGRDDRLTPPKYSEFLNMQLPAAHLEWVDRAGHLVMLERPEAVNRALRAFLQELARAH